MVGRRPSTPMVGCASRMPKAILLQIGFHRSVEFISSATQVQRFLPVYISSVHFPPVIYSLTAAGASSDSLLLLVHSFRKRFSADCSQLYFIVKHFTFFFMKYSKQESICTLIFHSLLFETFQQLFDSWSLKFIVTVAHTLLLVMKKHFIFLPQYQ